MPRVPAVLTPYTINEVLETVVDILEEVDPGTTSKNEALVHLAHTALECARWQLAYNNNFGNVKATPGSDRDYCYFTCTEVLLPAAALKYVATASLREDGKGLNAEITNKKVYKQADGTEVEKWTVRFWPTHPACCFRSLSTLKEGMLDHFNFLRQPRFAKAWAAADAGNPALFVQEIYNQRYFTADLAGYKAAVVSIFNEFSKKLVDWEPSIGMDEPSRGSLAVLPFSLQDLSWSIIEEDSRGHGIEEDESPPRGLQEVEGARGYHPQGAACGASGRPCSRGAGQGHQAALQAAQTTPRGPQVHPPHPNALADGWGCAHAMPDARLQ